MLCFVLHSQGEKKCLTIHQVRVKDGAEIGLPGLMRMVSRYSQGKPDR